MKWLKRAWGWITKQEEKNQKAAMAGKATSGYLTAGDRQRMFRNRPRPRGKA